jgi:hypothetical protein
MPIAEYDIAKTSFPRERHIILKLHTPSLYWDSRTPVTTDRVNN